MTRPKLKVIEGGKRHFGLPTPEPVAPRRRNPAVAAWILIAIMWLLIWAGAVIKVWP